MSNTQPHVLLVDNNLKSGPVLSTQLQALGYRVTLTPAEDQALTIARAGLGQSGEIDLALFVPHGHDPRLFRHLEADPALRPPARLVIIDTAEVSRLASYLAHGAEDYLRLPFNPVLWRARFEAHLNKKRLHHQEQARLANIRDLQIGHQIQVDFLPKQLPQLPGWEIAARFHPAREVAGDFYDAFTLPGNKVGLVVADVCDKGVGPALFMALSRTLVRAFAEQHRPLTWMENFNNDDTLTINRQQRRKLLSAGMSALVAVELTNTYITTNHADMNMFVTLFLGVLDPATGTLTYVNGGHDAPAIIGADGVLKTRLMPTGPAVGMLPGSTYEIEQVKLDSGDLLMAFSDGVTDARNPEGKRFMLNNFLTLLAQPAPSVESLLARVEAALFAHIATADQFDDITMLAVRRS
jgi:sigma-B regulation protein RsbU (phosphoserine phosphatase)